MWIEIDTQTFNVINNGFLINNCGNIVLYTSPNHNDIKSIRELKNKEYAQAIEINTSARTISFARDYLGHYPLLYTIFNGALFISDNIQAIIRWRRNKNGTLTISEEALAFYFSLGYIPHGMSLIEQIILCKNACIYHWQKNNIYQEELFQSIQVINDFDPNQAKEAIEQSINNYIQNEKSIGVWCSGGIDSSIVAACTSKFNKNTRLCTFTYDRPIISSFGEGELHYTQMMANYCNLPLRTVELEKNFYSNIYQKFLLNIHSPMINMMPPKFAMADSAQSCVLTGEGGDALFSGSKNNFILFMQNASMDKLNLGWLYALAHRAYFSDNLNTFMNKGEALKSIIGQYLEKYITEFDNNLTRNLFYTHTFLKQGSFIFPINYYAAKSNQIHIYHPLTSLLTYETAFKISDEKKYCYPTGKILLKQLFADMLPKEIIQRKKSPPQLPMKYYLKCTGLKTNSLDILDDLGLFKNDFLSKLLNDEKQMHFSNPTLLKYGLQVLTDWIALNLNMQ